MGPLSIDKAFTDGDDSEQVNQTVNGTDLFTTLKAIQMDMETAKFFGLAEKMKGLEKYGNCIDSQGVLLGDSYRGIFKKGDTFAIRYIGSKEIQCKVVGFFNDNEEIVIDGNKIPIDHYIISHSFDYQSNDDDYYKKVLLSVKCEGYLHYDNKQQRTDCINFIKSIKKSTGYKYDVPRIEKKLHSILNMSHFLSVMLLIVAAILLCVFCRYFLRFFRNRWPERSRAANIAGLGYIAVLSLVSYAIALNIFKEYNHLIFGAAIAYFIIVGLLWGLSTLIFHGRITSRGKN